MNDTNLTLIYTVSLYNLKLQSETIKVKKSIQGV